MVTVFCWPGATTAESRLQLALTSSPRHAFAALLSAEAADRVPSPDIPGLDDGGGDDQHNGQDSRERNCREHAVEHMAEYGGNRSGPRTGCRVRPIGEEREDGRGAYPDCRRDVCHPKGTPAPIDTLQFQQRSPKDSFIGRQRGQHRKCIRALPLRAGGIEARVSCCGFEEPVEAADSLIGWGSCHNDSRRGHHISLWSGILRRFH
jgi:hypothetical protein